MAAGLALAGSSRAVAQGCCSPGASPLGTLVSGFPAPGRVQAGVLFEFYELDRTRAGTEEVPDLADRYSRARRAIPYVRVGLPARLSLLVELPYEDRLKQLRFTTASGNRFGLDIENEGFGDLSSVLLFRAAPAADLAPWSLHVGAGVKWGTGRSARDGIPVELQNGTGSNDVLLAMSGHRNFSVTGVSAQSVVRLPSKSESGYLYGKELSLGAALFLAPGRDWSAGLETRHRSAGHDAFLNRRLPNTGGSRWLLGPRLAANWRRARLAVEVLYLFPVREDVNGTQLAVGRQMSFGLRWPS